MRIFSYIFYTFSKVYKAGLDKVHPDAYASGFLSLLQGINIYTILKPYLTESQVVFFWVIGSFTILPLNWFFLNRKTLEKFDRRWDKEPKGQRFFRRFLVIVYVVATFAVPITIYM